MALWWLCGGYVFPNVVKPDILTFELNLTLKVKSITPRNNTDLKQVDLRLKLKFGDRMGLKLSRGQVKGCHTDAHTDRRWQWQHQEAKTGLG